MSYGILLAEERTVLEKVVATLVFTSHNDLLHILKDHALHIEKADSPAKYARKIILYCEQSAWVENPALIIQLMNNWEVLPEISATIQRVKTLLPPIFFIGNQPWEACLVALNLPFIGRRTTRLAIPSFLQPLVDEYGDPLGKRVLIVNGASGSGKTYTHEYIKYLNSVYTTSSFKTAYIDYKTYVSSRFGAIELLESILAIIKPDWKVTASLPVLDMEQPARWRLQLVKFMATQIAATGQRWFIILDRFNNNEVPSETKEFIQLIADVATGAKNPNESKDLIRLVLLGFNSPIENYGQRVLHEDIRQLEREEIANYFRLYIRVKGINLDVNNQLVIDLLVGKVLEKDPGNVPERTKVLAQKALKTALDELVIQNQN